MTFYGLFPIALKNGRKSPNLEDLQIGKFLILVEKNNMCGRCGIYGLEDKELVKEMCAVLVHRDPMISEFTLRIILSVRRGRNVKR